MSYLNVTQPFEFTHILDKQKHLQVYIYIYIERERERERACDRRNWSASLLMNDTASSDGHVATSHVRPRQQRTRWNFILTRLNETHVTRYTMLNATLFVTYAHVTHACTYGLAIATQLQRLTDWLQRQNATWCDIGRCTRPNAFATP